MALAPLFVRMLPDPQYLPFAGLYDVWKNPDGNEIHSFTIITTQPTIDLKPIHNRMPVILEPAAEEVWLNPDVTDPQELTPLLHPYEVRALDRLFRYLITANMHVHFRPAPHENSSYSRG